jgi:hypothetical protein
MRYRAAEKLAKLTRREGTKSRPRNVEFFTAVLKTSELFELPIAVAKPERVLRSGGLRSASQSERTLEECGVRKLPVCASSFNSIRSRRSPSRPFGSQTPQFRCEVRHPRRLLFARVSKESVP